MTMRSHQLLSLGLAVALLPGCAVRLRRPAAPPVNVVPLVTTIDDGVADSQVVPIRLGDREAWLALDTGAPFTFLYSDPAGPEYVEHAGTITIGCETWQVPGYRDEAIGVEMFRGRPIVGLLGLDFFLDVPAAIDYPGGRLVRYLDGQLQGPLAALAPLQGPRVEGLGAIPDVPDLGDGQGQGAQARADRLRLEAVGVAPPLCRPLVVRRPEPGLPLQLHGLVEEELQGRGHAVQAFFDQVFQDAGNRGILRFVVGHSSSARCSGATTPRGSAGWPTTTPPLRAGLPGVLTGGGGAKVQTY